MNFKNIQYIYSHLLRSHHLHSHRLHSHRLRSCRKALVALLVLLLAACGTKKPVVDNGKDKIDPTLQEHRDSAAAETLPTLPGKDLRAVWVATIGGIDWPYQHFDEASQKAWYRHMLDTLQRLNVNTVFFQVRPKADAFYDSPYEPWTQYITGRRSVQPTYDVLRWLIDETHARGIAFHAWMNPYRVDIRKNTRKRFDKLDAKIPKHLVKDYRLVRLYNPALPETRLRLRAIVRDMLERYDVDGIHFDDYFYPALEKGEKMNDQAEYRRYGSDFATIADFRRAMVDSLIAGVRQTIDSVRPSAVFSISPQGNYENNYNTMYADIAQWSERGWCDLIIPQLYWSTERWFEPRLRWFAENAARNSHLAIGYGLYRFGDNAPSPYHRTAEDLGRQMAMAYGDKKVEGSVLYSAVWLMKNPVSINDTIAQHFALPALAPYLGQKNRLGSTTPDAPTGVVVSGNNVSWLPQDNCYYAVYRKDDNGNTTLVATTYATSLTVSLPGQYYVTAVRKGNNAESQPTKAVQK